MDTSAIVGLTNWKLSMQVGDKIQHIVNSATGIISEVKGKKWVKIAWSDDIILDEHIDDIKLIEKTLDKSKRL